MDDPRCSCGTVGDPIIHDPLAFQLSVYVADLLRFKPTPAAGSLNVCEQALAYAVRKYVIHV